MAIEEEIFYPAVQDTNEDISESVDEGEQEHHVAKVLIGERGEVEPASDVWVAKMMVLIENSSEEHTSELQSLMRISYAVLCLKQKTHILTIRTHNTQSTA